LEVRDRYRLIELLDPEITHYEFFLSRPPLEKTDWTNNAELLAAIPERHACIEGWPSRSFFNFDYQVVSISDAEYAFLEKCDPAQSQCVAEIFAAHQTNLEEGLKMVRQLQSQQLIVLSKSQK